MKVDRLENMVKGWFVGNFDPVVLRSQDMEVAVKTYRAGEVEAAHYHKVATEITVIVSGTAIMGGRTCESGDILTIEPGFATSFEAVTDVVTVVVKSPSVAQDKYLA